MNAQTAVATRGNSSPAVVFQQELTSRADQFKAALPGHITPEKFQRTVLTAVTTDPDLLNADRRTLLTACMKAAQDGLLPDKREAALVIFSTRKKDAQGQWHTVKEVQYMPMVYGLRKKILQSGEISTLDTNVVYRREVDEGRFIYEGGTEAMLRHRPMLDLSDEECSDDQIVAAYSIAVMKDGSKSFEVMRRGEIEKVRSKSQTGARVDRFGKPREPSGPWVDWFGEMARKTVMRRHSKTLPMSGDLIDVEADDDDRYARSVQGALTSEERPALPRKSEGGEQIEHQPDDSPRDFGDGADERQPEPSGRTDEADEETARRLDAQTMHGADADEGDETGDVGAVQDDQQERYDAIMEAINGAKNAVDLKAADGMFTRDFVRLTEEQGETIEAALNAKRRALTAAHQKDD